MVHYPSTPGTIQPNPMHFLLIQFQFNAWVFKFNQPVFKRSNGYRKILIKYFICLLLYTILPIFSIKLESELYLTYHSVFLSHCPPFCGFNYDQPVLFLYLSFRGRIAHPLTYRIYYGQPISLSRENSLLFRYFDSKKGKKVETLKTTIGLRHT